ncbi:MAG TPA: glycosyltransferase family 39 protein [Alphaproteobacteria bacterium]|jgi:4-amino-4-deoxy-L-arabinose transferase-like glycosyltransferase|nr:glycosyltransferase family 39 protein [Alphaproteobacteria bacterium]
MKKYLLALFFVLLLAFGLRIYHLNLLPVFADEAIYIRWSQIMASEATLRFLPLSDGKQPLFMWILMFFVKKFSDPLFAGRLISAFAGIGSMIGLFCLTYYIFKSKLSALISSILWALSPLSLFFDRMALVDSLLTCFGIWTLFLSLITAETLRLDVAMILGFVLGLASLTKSPALFFAALIPVAVILLKDPKKIFKCFGLLAAAYVIAFGMYNIQRLGPNFNLLTSRTADYVFPLSRILIYPTDPIRYNLPTAFGWLIQMAPFGLLLLAIFGVWKNFRNHTKQVLILGIWFAAPLLFESEFTKSFTLRYILFLVPALYVLAASAFVKNSKLVWAALVIFVIQAVIFDFFLLTNPAKANFPQRERMGYFQEWTSGIGIKESADYIRNVHNQNPEKQIIVGTEGYFGTLPDGFAMYVQDIPNIVVVGVGLGLNKIPDSLVASKKAGNLTYLIINKSRLITDPAKLNLKLIKLTLIKSFVKEPRIPGTMEFEASGPQDELYLFEVQ